MSEHSASDVKAETPSTPKTTTHAVKKVPAPVSSLLSEEGHEEFADLHGPEFMRDLHDTIAGYEGTENRIPHKNDVMDALAIAYDRLQNNPLEGEMGELVDYVIHEMYTAFADGRLNVTKLNRM